MKKLILFALLGGLFSISTVIMATEPNKINLVNETAATWIASYEVKIELTGHEKLGPAPKQPTYYLGGYPAHPTKTTINLDHIPGVDYFTITKISRVIHKNNHRIWYLPCEAGSYKILKPGQSLVIYSTGKTKSGIDFKVVDHL